MDLRITPSVATSQSHSPPLRDSQTPHPTAQARALPHRSGYEHHPIAQDTSTSLEGPITGYELQELRATHLRVTPNVAFSQSHPHPIAQVTSTPLEGPVAGNEL